MPPDPHRLIDIQFHEDDRLPIAQLEIPVLRGSYIFWALLHPLAAHSSISRSVRRDLALLSGTAIPATGPLRISGARIQGQSLPDFEVHVGSTFSLIRTALRHGGVEAILGLDSLRLLSEVRIRFDRPISHVILLRE